MHVTVYCLSKPQGVCIGVVVSGICILSHIEHYGKEHDVGSKKLDGTKWIVGCLVFVGCAAVIFVIPMTIMHYLYETTIWEEKSKLYLCLVSD